MYALAKKGREDMKAKARRLADMKDSKVDSSDYSPPERLKADIKTGMRPLSRTAYKSGGSVGKANTNTKIANEEREGEKHVGGLKKGGAAKADGGAANANKMTSPSYRKELEARQNPQAKKPHSAPATTGPKNKPVDNSTMTGDEAAKFMEGRKYGGRSKKMGGGSLMGGLAAGAALGELGKDREKRQSGGRTNGRTNVNIVIAAGGSKDGPGMGAPPKPPVGPPPGMPMPSGPSMVAGAPPPGMPPAMAGGMPPMGRKSGGRVARSYKDMTAGAGSGEGRLEKSEIQKSKGSR